MRPIDWPLLGHAAFGSLVGVMAYPTLYGWLGVGRSEAWLFGCAIVGGLGGMDWWRKYGRKHRDGKA